MYHLWWEGLRMHNGTWNGTGHSGKKMLKTPFFIWIQVKWFITTLINIALVKHGYGWFFLKAKQYDSQWSKVQINHGKTLYEVRGCPVVRSLDPCSKKWIYLQTCHKLWGENMSPLCRDSRPHGKRSHWEERPGLHCSTSLTILRALCALHLNQYLTKIVSVFAYQPISS